MLSPTLPLQASWLRERLFNEASRRRVTVAIGVGIEREGYPEKIGHEACKAIEHGIADIKLVGTKEAIERASRVCSKAETIVTRYPEVEIIRMLVNGEVDAVVRGTLSAKNVVAEIKRAFMLDKLHRIAILETHDHIAFFFAPVGIDEGNDLEDKMRLIEGGIKLQKTLGVKTAIAVLSGGRLEDYGRSSLVDETLDQAEDLVKRVRKKFQVEIYHQGILIEDAVKKATLVIAPNGMIGNIIFRVLTLIGGGEAFGAPVVDVLPKVFVDVSRAMENYLDSIALSAALANLALPT
ncbi:MAG: methanogenesis marker protein Mmp4/MtxX [Candidatus Nezhaarchaeales archaeon]